MIMYDVCKCTSWTWSCLLKRATSDISSGIFYCKALAAAARPDLEEKVLELQQELAALRARKEELEREREAIKKIRMPLR